MKVQKIRLTGDEMVSLYITELGKPHCQIRWYQKNSWIDASVLNWVRKLRGIHMPEEYQTIVEASKN